MVVSVPAVVVVVSCGTVVSGGFVLVVGDVVAPGTLVVPSAGPAPSTHWSLPAIASDHVTSSNECTHIFVICFATFLYVRTGVEKCTSWNCCIKLTDVDGNHWFIA